MEQLRIRAFDRVTLRGPAKMSPEKVLRRAETVFAFAQQRAEDGNHKYMEVLRDQAARWIFLDLYLVGRAKNLSREEMAEKLGRFWVDKLK